MPKFSGYYLFCIAICIFCAVSGCTSSTSDTKPVDTTQVIESGTQPETLPSTIVTTVPVLTEMITTQVPITVVTTLEKSSFEAGADDPQILNLIFYKNYFNSGISNCIMKEAFPEAAKDSEYGIRQTPPKIIAISPSELNVFLREYTEGKNEDAKTVGISRCEGIPVTPYWNFIKVDAKIMPRNANPSEYDIGINIRSQGKVIAQFAVTEELTINQPLAFESYIPLKSEEMEFFDSIELVFNKRTN